MSEFEFVSVLLAFGLQPWWEDRLEKAEEGRLPTSVLAEFRSNQIAPDSAIAFQEAAQTTTLTLLQLAAWLRRVEKVA